MKFLLLLLSLLMTLSAAPKPLDKVSLQLMWLDQFQFAGYYMAKEKGFYKDVGLDVEIKKFTCGLDTPDEVLSGRANFGVGRSSLVRLYSQGKKVVLLSAILQSSPTALISLASSNINSVKDFAGKKLMLTQDVAETASIKAMIKLHDINVNSIIVKEHTFNLEDLIDGKVDLYSGYISNELYLLSQRGIPYTVFSPKEDGFDFYSDILFTSQAELEKNPRRVEVFREASLKGWEYAFNNIDETVDFIYKNYNVQNKTKDALKYEAASLKKLAYTSDSTFGEINENKVQRIYDMYRLMGLAKGKLYLNGLIYNQHISMFSNKERDYLNEKKEIKICVQSNWLPFSVIENEKFIGIGSSIMDKVNEIIKIPFVLVKTKTWEESLNNIKERKCDMLPVAENIPSRRAYLKFTTPYYAEPLVIVTKNTNDYILDFESVIDKEFAIVKENSFTEKLIQKYPDIKLRYVSSIEEGLQDVENGKYHGYIDVLMSCSYALKSKSNDNLRITGQFYDKVKLSFAIRSDEKTLFNIFEKIAEHIPPSIIEKYISEWVSVNYTESVNYKYLKEVLLVFLLIGAAFLYRHNLLKKKNIELQRLQEELVALNGSLESRVQKVISDAEKKDAYLLHQSRLAQMGEMLSMIAHQWRQPLNSISVAQISITVALELQKYDLADEKQREDFLDFLRVKMEKVGQYVQSLSDIIDNFSDFYKPNKTAVIGTLDKSILKGYSIIYESIKAEQIEIDLDLNSHHKIKLHENEFMQVIINILNNAREHLVDNNVHKPYIKIKSFDVKNETYIEISDNAGGINEEIMEKIFDPYFSTKLEKNGTGLGLYMSKMIIKDYHSGDIYAKNSDIGAIFTIKIKKYEDISEK